MANTPDNLEPARASGAEAGRHTNSLFLLVYEELRDYAHRLFQRQHAPGKTLQPTAVVHEVFVRLAAGKDGQPDTRLWNDRAHFFRVAARAMRMVLVDYARSRQAQKRGGEEGGWQRVTLELADLGAAQHHMDLLALDEALERLAARNERHARVVELRLFGGLTDAEIAAQLGVCERTVGSDWRLARAWLNYQLREVTD